MTIAPRVVSPPVLRRFLLEAQGLPGGTPAAVEPSTPARVLRLIRRLECVQIDPVSVVERNQHLVLAARLPGYSPAMLNRLRLQRRVFEYWANGASVIPMEDYPLFAGVRQQFQLPRAFLTKFGRLMETILARLAAEGPLPSRAFESGRRRVHWWWDKATPRTKDTSYVLNYLWYAGRVMVVRREGVERYFDLPEKVVPADVLRRAQQIEVDDANEALFEKYMRAYRVSDTGQGWRFGWRKMAVAERREVIGRHVRAGTIVPLQIPGVRRQYFVLAEDLDRLRRHEAEARLAGRAVPDGPIRFLPPLDNLLWRRERLADLFGFTYKWEIYDPPAKRRYGYYVMPILAGERFIGRMDPRYDRERNQLEIQGLWLEPGVTPTKRLSRNLREALDAFSRFHGASGMVVRRTVPRGLSV
jgi:uncharacterized protein YcaQ